MKKIPWSTARSRVLKKYPLARVVWSHGGRMVLLDPEDSPLYSFPKVSNAWREAYRRLK